MIIVQIKVLMTISATTMELCKAMATTVAKAIGTSRMVIKSSWNKNKTRIYNYLRAAICSEYAKQPDGTSSVRFLTAYATHAASASINANINNNYSGASAPSEVAICATSKVNPSPEPKKQKPKPKSKQISYIIAKVSKLYRIAAFLSHSNCCKLSKFCNQTQSIFNSSSNLLFHSILCPAISHMLTFR